MTVVYDVKMKSAEEIFEIFSESEASNEYLTENFLPKLCAIAGKEFLEKDFINTIEEIIDKYVAENNEPAYIIDQISTLINAELSNVFYINDLHCGSQLTEIRKRIMSSLGFVIEEEGEIITI